MNGFVDFVFAEMWEYTKLTFRIFRWLFGVIALVAAWVLNRRQNQVTPERSNLFDPDAK